MASKKVSSTSDAFRRELNGILDELFRLKAFAAYNLSLYDDQRSMLSWARTSQERMIDDFSHLSVENYITWARRGDYSAILWDGALLQMTYHLDGAGISGHRLSYVPSPVMHEVDSKTIEQRQEWLGEEFASAVTDSLLDAPWEAGLRSMIRFDYDPKNAKPGHPAAHLTLNSVDCRIPCIAPMGPGHFVEFIFEHFYPGERKRLSRYFDASSQAKRRENLLTDSERSSIHISW